MNKQAEKFASLSTCNGTKVHGFPYSHSWNISNSLKKRNKTTLPVIRFRNIVSQSIIRCGHIIFIAIMNNSRAAQKISSFVVIITVKIPPTFYPYQLMELDTAKFWYSLFYFHYTLTKYCVFKVISSEATTLVPLLPCNFECLAFLFVQIPYTY